MGINNAGGPTEEQRMRFLQKIDEWRALGFETDDLEYLLENDFDEFLHRRHEILKQQLPNGKPPEATPATKGEIESKMTPEEPPIKEPKDEDLLLLGEPLVPATEPALEPVEEGIIVVSKPKRPLKSKVHRTRVARASKIVEEPEEPEEEPTSEPALESSEEEDLEQDWEETEPLEDEEYAEEEKTRPVKKLLRTEKPKEGTVGGRIATAAVIIIVISAVYYFAIVNPVIDFGGIGNGGSESEGKVKAEFVIRAEDGYYSGAVITFDAMTSSGKNLKFTWTFDNDFRILDGTRQSERVDGYFTTTENAVQAKPITLKVENKDNEDSMIKEVSIQPRSFEITEEMLSDLGNFKVEGSLDIENPDGIATYSTDDADMTINTINVKFNTKESKDMTIELTAVNNVDDGFHQSHSVYEREIVQNLLLSGTIAGRAQTKSSLGGFVPPGNYPFTSNLDGTMNTIDKSYIDFETYNTIYGLATNDLQITIPIKFENYEFYTINVYSNDSLESYPDLRKNPMEFELQDLSKDDRLEIGDSNAIVVGEIIYHWYAEKIEYLYERPVIKVNLSIDDYTKTKYNLQDFFSAFWIADGISQPVKTHLNFIHKQKGNTTTLNYISEMTDFKNGVTIISTQSCPSSTPEGHFYTRRPGYEYIPTSNWTYLPPTGQSIRNQSTSFDSFTSDQAIIIAKNHQGFINYTSTHSDCYVVTGFCTATGDGGHTPGTLTWNLTLGSKDSGEALNLIISQDGSVNSKLISIDNPPNSTVDFEPLLTFASSEDVLLTYRDKEFFNIIFDENDKIDFDNINYGVDTNLAYPNVDITAIGFIEYTKYCYLITYNQKTGDRQEIVSVALDAETGQLLFYWDHEDNGLDFSMI